MSAAPPPPPQSPQPHPPTLLPLKFKWPEPDRSNIATHCCYFPGSKYIVKIRHIQKAAVDAAAVAAGKKKRKKRERSHGSVLPPPPRCHPFNKYFNKASTRLGLVEEAGEHPNGVQLFFLEFVLKKRSRWAFFTRRRFRQTKNSRRRDREREKKKRDGGWGSGRRQRRGGEGWGGRVNWLFMTPIK